MFFLENLDTSVLIIFCLSYFWCAVRGQGCDDAQKKEDGSLSDRGGSPPGIDGQHHGRHRLASIEAGWDRGKTSCDQGRMLRYRGITFRLKCFLIGGAP